MLKKLLKHFRIKKFERNKSKLYWHKTKLNLEYIGV